MIDKFMHGFLNRVYGYDDYTQLEINSKLIQKMDEVIDNCNNAFEYLEWLKGQGLSDEVIKNLLEWKEDGTFEKIINQNLFNGLNNKIDEINTQLDTNVQKIITPEMFGAVGDGITNDFEAIKKCFSYSNAIINFGKSKIYSIDSVGIESNAQNIIINGNNSIIKISDKNIVLNTIYNSVGAEKDRTIVMFYGDNVEINNIYFDANNDNNFILYNGKKYYGLQKDIVSDLPNSPNYLTIDAIIARGNNYKITNCIFEGFGNAVQCGGVWGSNVKKYNYEIKNCEFLNGFRDQITACDGENLNIIDCTFRDNQRKAIQFYRNFNNGVVSKCDIKNTIDNIRLWYPTWSSSNSDAELLGIGISNPGYDDCCNYIKIENCKIDVPKNCIVARNFSKNIIIENNYLKSDDICILMHKGLLNNFTIKNNYLDCKYGINLYLGNMSTNYDTENLTINIEKNTIKAKNQVYRFLHDDISSKVLNACYIYLKDNKYLATNTNYLQAIKENSKLLPVYVHVYDYDNILNVNNHYYINVENISENKKVYEFNTGSRQSSNGCYYKIATFEFTELLTRLTLKGEISKSSGDSFAFTNFFVSLRTHYSTITGKPSFQVMTYNNITSNKYGVHTNITYVDDKMICELYFSVPTELTGGHTVKTEILNTNLDNKLKYSFNYTDKTWLNELTGTYTFNSTDV